MALLQLLSEERIPEDSVCDYFEALYSVVCVGERMASMDHEGGLVRSTYIVDWEQLVHLLESYAVFGEDIVEVKPFGGEISLGMRNRLGGIMRLARA